MHSTLQPVVSELKKLSYSLLLIIASLGIIIIFLPAYSPFFEIPYNSKRAFQIVFLVLAGILVLFNKHKTASLLEEIYHIPKIILSGISTIFLVGIISSLFSNHIFYGLGEVSLFVLLFLFLLFTIHFYKQYEKLFVWFFLGILAVSAAVYLLHFSLSYINSFFVSGFPVWPNINFLQLYSNGKPLFPEPFLGFVHVRFLNHIHTWSLPLLALLVVKIPKKYWAVQYCSFALLSFWWMLVFAADARGTMLSSALSLLFVSFLFRKRIISWIKIYTGSALIGLSLYALLFKTIQSGGGEVLSRYGDSGRWQMWELALQLVRENPLLGAGPMHYADYANGFIFAAPHNIYLQIASEWGLVAFIILAVICISGYIAWIKFCREKISESNKKHEGQYLQVLAALTASLTAGAIHGFFSGIINTPLSQLVMVLLLGWMIGLYHKEKKIKSRKVSIHILKKQRIVFKSMVFGLLVFFSGMTYYSYKNLDESRTLYLDQSESLVLYPRFWDHGIIGVEPDTINELNNQNN